MKRKNPEFAKARRFIRKAKFTENLNSTSYLYIKLFLLWFLVVVTDFLIEFRFEYLWPIYLLIKNLYETFKNQGIAFSAFFVFITLTSNMICFFLIPVQWLFFTASTYVWFQYVWNSEKGICLQTFTIWLIFVYIEATVRLKEFKSMSNNLELCRPFAAQCVGYPFVTLSFGFKKYINNKILTRKQKTVNMENELSFHALNKSIPVNNEITEISTYSSFDSNSSSCLTQQLIKNNFPNVKEEERISSLNNQILVRKPTSNNIFNKLNGLELRKLSVSSNNFKNNSNNKLLIDTISKDHDLEVSFFENINVFFTLKNYFYLLVEKLFVTRNKEVFELSANEQKINSKTLDVNNKLNEEVSQKSIKDKINNSAKNNSRNLIDENVDTSLDNTEKNISQSSLESKNRINLSFNSQQKIKEENYLKMESEFKKLKLEFQLLRQTEIENKEKLNKIQIDRNELKILCGKLQNEKAELQSRINSLSEVRQLEKKTYLDLEKKFQEERKLKTQFEKQLLNEKKLRNTKDIVNSVNLNKSINSPNSISRNNSIECEESCKNKRQKLESLINKSKEDVQNKNYQLMQLKEEKIKILSKQQEIIDDLEILKETLNKVNSRNSQLENQLSAETKLKLDLFSVLGETRRLLEANEQKYLEKLNEVETLKIKFSEYMSILPNGLIDPYSIAFSSNFINQQEQLNKEEDLILKTEQIIDESLEWKNLTLSHNLEATSDKILTPSSSSSDL